MKIPSIIPGYKIFIILFAAYSAIWISLEGALWQVLTMGIGSTLLLAANWMQRYLGGKSFSVMGFVGITAVIGLLIGITSTGSTLAFMAIKTGLHNHGPEFTQAEISWTIQQLPLWGIVGLLIGTAIGLIYAGGASSET